MTIGAEEHRVIRGVVYYRGGEPAAGAAVQLEDRATMQVVSQIADSAGRFHFFGLNPEKEYSVSAVKKEYRSKAHHIDRFSPADVNLKLVLVAEK